MCVNPFNLFKSPKPPQALLPAVTKKPDAPEEVQKAEPLITEEDTKQKVRTSSKKSNVLLSKGSPASKFTSPIPGGTKKSGGINV